MAPPPAEEKPDGFKKSGGFAGLMRSGGKPNGTHVYKKDDSFGSTPIVSLFKVVCKAGSAGEISGTEVSLSGPDVPGLLACITGHFSSRGYNIHSTKGEPLPGATSGVKDTFVVTYHGGPLGDDEEMSLTQSLREMADQLHVASAKKKKEIQEYSVDVVDGEVDDATTLIIEGPDAPGLLGAITSTLSASSCSIITFSGETLKNGKIRDRFVVQVNGKPLEAGVRAPLVRRLQESCRKLLAPENGGAAVESKFYVIVTSSSTDTSITVDGPDVPGLLSKLSSALSSDGYEIVAFEAGRGADPSKTSDEGVHDVFRVVRDGKPLSEEEAAACKSWITQVSDKAYAEAARLNRSATSSGGFNSSKNSSPGGSQNGSGHNGKMFRGFVSCLPKSGKKGGGAGNGRVDEVKSQIAELTALERQGLIAALKQKGDIMTAATDLLQNGKEVTQDEIDTLAKALGEGVLSDVMKRSQIDPSEVQVGDVIGAGVFGEVRSGQLHGTPVAIKTMHRSRIVDGGLDLFKAECELCLSLRHPNIVQLLGACWRLDAPTVFMVMERCDSTLSEALRDAKSGRRDDFDYTNTRVPIALGVARAMSYLHAQKPPILHRDLKPDNVLLTRDAQPKVSDFGSSRDVEKMALTQVGTPLFSAPEIMAHEPYDGSADVWSFGCILSCISELGVEPYPRDLLYGMNVNGIMKAVINGSMVPLHTKNAGALGEVGKKCNSLDPTRRPSFKQVVDLLQEKSLMAWAEKADEVYLNGANSHLEVA